MELLNQSIQWHITEVCPNRCKHCYIGDMTNEERRRAEIGFEDMIVILNNFEEFEQKYNVTIKNFIITGGDPFEHPDFGKLLKELHSREKNICILGIPERINKENIRWLESYKVRQYQVSLDGMQKTHDMIRGKNSFAKTIEAIKYLSRYSSIQPAIMYTLHKQNCNEMFDLIDYLVDEDINAVFAFDFMVLTGFGKENFELLDKYKVDEILNKYREKRKQLIENGSKLILTEKVKLFDTFDVENANDKFEKYSYISGCYCGISSVAILPNGDCLPCRRLPIMIGNLLKEKYSDLFLNNPLMRKLRRISSYKLCNDCDYAKVCRGCAALAYSSTGDAFGELLYCNKKKKVEPKLHEPSLECTEKEEFEYVSNNLQNALEREGVTKNLDAVKYHVYREFIKAY